MVDLNRVFKDLDRLDAPVSWSQVAGRRPTALSDEPHRPRKVMVAVFAFVVAIAGIALLVGAFGIPLRHPAPLSSSALFAGSTSTSTSPAPEVGASGLVVAYSPSDVRFCNGVIPADLTAGPPACAPQIRAVSVDLSALSNQVTAQGVTWGTAFLAGTFSDGTLQVNEQGPPRPTGNGPRLVDPPCSPPPTGWATGSVDEPSTTAVEAYESQFPSDVASVAMFHPQSQTWVVTIASTDPARTTAALGAEYPDQLCVVQSRYQVSDVHDAKAAATALLSQDQYGVTAVGLTTGTDGQPVVEVEAVSDTPELRDALASQPAGLVNIVPWLKPVSG